MKITEDRLVLLLHEVIGCSVYVHVLVLMIYIVLVVVLYIGAGEASWHRC